MAHGDNDAVIPVAHSLKLVEDVKAAGSERVILKRFPDAPPTEGQTDELTGHASWVPTYTDPEWWEWAKAATL